METTILVVLLFLIWYAIGIASFIYYVTFEYDFCKSDVLFALIAGLGGLITSLCAFTIILSGSLIKNDKILFKKQK
jgi:hypothetical protein